MKSRFVVAMLAACCSSAIAAPKITAGQVDAALAAAAGAKVAVSETYARTGQWPNDGVEAGYQQIEDTRTDVVIGAGGVITVAIGAGTISLAPAGADGQVTWTCKAKDIPARALPAGCR